MSVLSSPEMLRRAGDPLDRVRPARIGLLARFFRARLTAGLRYLETGQLRLRDEESEWVFGSGRDGLAGDVHVRDARAYRALALGGSLGAAEAYLNGWWTSDDLVRLFRVLTRNARVLSRLDGVAARCLRGVSAWAHGLRRNTLSGSRRNIAAHYDLGEDFYSLFLDETMTYSSGVFTSPTSTLADASREKYDRICRKLQLSPRDHVLEIGTGWGGFALHAARTYGCRITTTTISRRQYEHARQRVELAGLSERVTVLCEDYRRLSGSYDHLVSIEMIESVGHEYLDAYFRQCCRLVRPEGMMALQAITIPDHLFADYSRSVDFIQKYVFPGGCLPAIATISDAVRRATDFRFLHLEDFGHHYAETLARWRQRFWQHISQVRALGFGERFIRLWHYYLCYCEAGFLENQIGVCQVVLARPGCRRGALHWTRDHDPLTAGGPC